MKIEEGKGVVKGIAIGEPYLNKRNSYDLNSCHKIEQAEIHVEKERLKKAIEDSKEEIRFLKSSLDKKIEKSDLQILTVHLMMLEDPMFLQEIEKGIKKDLITAECSVKRAADKFTNLFEKIEDPIYKQRALDIKDVSERIINNIFLAETGYQDMDGKILVTDELLPSELLKIYQNGSKPEGIIMEYAGETSHVAILAKALEIPTLMGGKNLFGLSWSELVILDTVEEKAKVINDPEEEVLKEYRKKKAVLEENRIEIEKNIDLPSVTLDGVKVSLQINVVGETEAEILERKKPDGIGLLRTEMIYMEAENFPEEEKQYELYDRIGKDMKGKPVIIRTLDIGADKQLPYYTMETEQNPSLGVRGLRFSLHNQEIFKEQLRAILRASAKRNLKVMFPMVTNYQEVITAKKILEYEKDRLREKGIPFNEDIEVGIMVEVPSVIFVADIMAEEVDFFSIGTNDLTQYILATDRFNSSAGELYDPYAPCVLRAINMLAETGRAKNTKVSVCGELAGEEMGAVILLSFGIMNLSMIASSILVIRNLIRKIDSKTLPALKEKILKSRNSAEVKEIVKEFIDNL